MTRPRSRPVQAVAPPLVKVAVAAILDNPYAGRFERDLGPLTKASEEVGRQVSARAVALMGAHKPVSYGKAGLVGVNGEQEHAVAMLTTVFGNVMRDAAGGGKAWISSFTKRVAIGRDHRHSARAQGRALRPLALRRHHHHAAGCAGAERDRDHLRLCEPRASNHRVGGLAANEIKGVDGLVVRMLMSWNRWPLLHPPLEGEGEHRVRGSRNGLNGAEHERVQDRSRTHQIAEGRPHGLYRRQARAGRHRTSGLPQFDPLGSLALRFPGAAREHRADDVQAGRREPPRQPRLADSAQPRRDGPATEGAPGLG